MTGPATAPDPRLFSASAFLAGFMLVLFSIVLLGTYAEAYANGFTLTITVDTVGEFWAEVGLFVCTMVFGAAVVAWASRRMGRGL